jgi:dynein heavy chain, axonemal
MGGLVIMNLDYIKNEKKGKVIMKADPDNPYGKKIPDYFSSAKQYLLNEPKKLLSILLSYDKEGVNVALIQMLEKEIIPSDDFTESRANSCSLAVRYIYLWINGIYQFHRSFIETQPLRDELARVEKIVEEKLAFLKEKKSELEAINKRLAELEETLNSKLAYKRQL